LSYAHELIRQLVGRLVSEGATFVALAGREPRTPPEHGGLAQIFDWTILSTLHERLIQGEIDPKSTDKLITTVVTAQTEQQIPDDRRPIWDALIREDRVAIVPGEWAWTSGAIRRAHLASRAEILITLGGGEGVEHYGSLFRARSKPVIPLDLDVGSGSDDGSGGSLRVLERVRHDPQLFFPNTESGTVNALLQGVSTREGKTALADVVEGVIRLLREIAPPTAFYVRLLNPELPEYTHVEQFFRGVVDPFIKELDYTPVQMTRTPASQPLLDVEIFGRLNESTLVIADITAGRPNCFVELGYALALGRQVVLTAMQGTKPPFDVQSVDRFVWDTHVSSQSTLERLRQHWRVVRTRPSLIEALRGL
jgi:hypothetical protein